MGGRVEAATVAAAGNRRPRLSRSVSPARWTEYRTLLEAAASAGYRLLELESWLDEPDDSGRPTLILRHDVDQDPGSALKMHRVESEVGVRSTWYFRWRTARSDVISEIREADAGIGFHYETLTRMVRERGLSPAEASPLVREARERLRGEIAAFSSRFGPVRSVCPHGDTRVPGISNAILLEGQDARAYGVDFDGNAAMAGHRLGCWLTDRLAADGRWANGASPSHLFAARVSPILCVVHPNNWASGLSLWRDRAIRAAAVRRVPWAARIAPTDRPLPRDG